MWAWFALGTALSTLATGGAQAEGRAAFLLSPDTADSVPLSRALLEAGYDVSRRAWDGAGAPPLDNTSAGTVIVHTETAGGGRALLSRLAQLAPGRDVVLLSEGCLPADVITPARLVVVAPTFDENGRCARPATSLSDALIAAMAQPDQPLSDALELPVGVRVQGQLPNMNAAAFTDTATTEPVVIGRAPVSVGTPVTVGNAVTPVALTPTGATPGPSSLPTSIAGAVRIDPVSQPAALLSARETPTGLPRPSIIVGVIRDPNASEAVDAGGALAGAGLETDNFDARETLRAVDPEGYIRLVEAGAFDPLPGTLPASLQRVLQRMDCYTLAVDGDWGNGSRAAVDRYYSQRGDTAPTREAEVSLFRDIIQREDVTCPPPPAPVATAVSRPAPSGGGGASRPRAPVPQATQPAAQPTAPATTNTISPTFSGAFR